MALTGVAAAAIIAALSVICLVVAAEIVVRALVGLARYYDISESVIGLTVLSLGTSLPEIAAHLVGSTQILLGVGDPRLISATVLGGNIGSDVVQQTLVLGLVVLAVGGFEFSKQFLLRGYGPMIGTTLLTLVLAWDGRLTRLDGLILVAMFAGYTLFLYTTRNEVLQQQSVAVPTATPRRDALITALGILTVVVAAHFLFQSVGVVVRRTGLEGSLIGVTVLGIGAASPEMTTAIVGLRKGAEGLSLGTLIGSNITNPLLGIGLGSALSTYAVPMPVVYWDLPMETGTAALLLTYLLTKDDLGSALAGLAGRLGWDRAQQRLSAVRERHLGRVGAVLLILLYIVYLVIRVVYFPEDF